MPCMCYYDPPEESKKMIKSLCEKIVTLGISIKETKELLDHLYDPNSCKEKQNGL